MEIYAAKIHDVDNYVAPLINTLQIQGELDNTIILYTRFD